MSDQQSTGLLVRDWKKHPLGEIPGARIWTPEEAMTDGPVLDDWRTLIVETPKHWMADRSSGLKWFNQNPNPSCTLYSAAQHIQWLLARHARSIPQLDPLKAWKELTGGHGGAALPDAAVYLMEQGMPIVGGGRIKVLAMWDLPSAAAALSEIALGRGAWIGWNHPEGAHAMYCLGVPEPQTAEAIGTCGENLEPWKRIPYSGLSQGIARFSGFSFLDVEVLDPQGDAAE